MATPDSLPWTGNADADRFLAESGLALVIGMLLDQQFPMERAFYGPYLLQERLGAPLDCTLIVETDPDQLAVIFRGPPAIHRYPGSMAKRTQEVCGVLLEKYDGVAERLWETAETGGELFRRLRELPGFGVQKARIFVGIVGKRLGAGPPGWEENAADWPSIADVAKWEDVADLRARKKEMKSAR